jgi:hypothetical protein
LGLQPLQAETHSPIERDYRKRLGRERFDQLCDLLLEIQPEGEAQTVACPLAAPSP